MKINTCVSCVDTNGLEFKHTPGLDMKSLLLATAATAFELEYASETQKHAFKLNLSSGASLSDYLLDNTDIFIHSAGQKYSARDGNLVLVDSFMQENIRWRINQSD